MQKMSSCKASNRRCTLKRAGAAVLCVAAFLLSGVGSAQGIKRIENCADPIRPVEAAVIELPVTGAHDYSVLVTFIIDVNGAVVVPKVKESKLNLVGSAEGVQAKADAAFLAAFARWKYAKRPVPCAASAEYEISVGV